MADLSSSNVTVISSWTTGNVNSRRNKVKRVKWTSTTAGGTSNKLLASALGMTVIERCSNILLDSSTKKVYPATPAADGSYILAIDPTQATDANRANVADVATSTDYAYCTVEGY
jgi:hypothetical protein